MELPGTESPAAAPRETHFFLIAEQGILESQALLLCESIRAFAGSYSKSPVTVISPRKDRRPVRETRRQLARMDIEYLPLNLQSPCPGYGTSFRILAASLMEQQSRAAVLVQLDSDTIFTGEPDFGLAGSHAAARPVDVKGMCTAGDGDEFDPYWRALCELFGVDYDSISWVTTTVDRKVVRANFNGGLVAVRRQAGLFCRTEEFFLRLVAANYRPWLNSPSLVKSGTGMVNREGSDFWGTSQAAFSFAVTAIGGTLQILPSSYNVPLHSFEFLPPMEAPPIHVHYHWLCSQGEQGANPLCDGRLPLTAPVRDWITSRMPLRVPEPAPFERILRHVF